MELEVVFFMVGAYLVGSISTAVIVCKLMGLADPREGGSGNPGATNVLRIGGDKGKKAAGFTLVGDMLKGLLPVLVAKEFGLDNELVMLVGFLAFMGHLYPVFFGFKGGKGVATMMGVMLGLSLSLGLAVILTWLFVAKILRISSLSALIAAILAPVYLYYLEGEMSWVIYTAVMAAILFWRHRGNIQRLISGEENFVKAKKNAK